MALPELDRLQIIPGLKRAQFPFAAMSVAKPMKNKGNLVEQRRGQKKAVSRLFHFIFISLSDFITILGTIFLFGLSGAAPPLKRKLRLPHILQVSNSGQASSPAEPRRKAGIGP